MGFLKRADARETLHKIGYNQLQIELGFENDVDL